MITKKQAGWVCAVLAASYSNWSATRERVEIYYEMLKDLDFEVLENATQAWVQSEKWPPTIADLRGLCAEITGSLAPTIDQAWGEVQRSVMELGHRQKPNWSHPAVASAVDAVGWWNLCMTTNPDTTRAHFNKAYETCRTRENRTVQISPALAQAIEGTFRTLDLPTPAAVGYALPTGDRPEQENDHDYR